MRFPLKTALLSLILLLSLAGIATAQAGRNRQATNEQKKVERTESAPATTEQKNEKSETPETPIDASQQDVETVKVETNLVTVPVIVSDRGDKYISDLKQEE